jgi:hypothetical protein
MAFAAAATTTLHIVFHGNCIDGWFSTYIAHTGYHILAANAGISYSNVKDVKLWPISPNQEWTWSAIPIRGCHVLLLDVSLPEKWLMAWERAALSVYCVDHHVTSQPVWAERPLSTIRIDRCATWLTWELVYPELPVPEWVALIDRIDRWTDVTLEDRALRELMYPIATLPVKGQWEEALIATRQFLDLHAFPSFRSLQIENGKKALARKVDEFKAVLEKQPVCVLTVDETHCTQWGLPDVWKGHRVFIVDGTGVAIDSTDAGASIFDMYPDVSVFVTYRHKYYTNRRTGREEHTILYSVRAHEKAGIDLTAGSVFAGHPCSAGGMRAYEKSAAFMIETM